MDLTIDQTVLIIHIISFLKVKYRNIRPYFAVYPSSPPNTDTVVRLSAGHPKGFFGKKNSFLHMLDNVLDTFLELGGKVTKGCISST